MFQQQYGERRRRQRGVEQDPGKGGELFDWDDASTYIQEPPFFTDLSPEPKPIKPISGAGCW